MFPILSPGFLHFLHCVLRTHAVSFEQNVLPQGSAELASGVWDCVVTKRPALRIICSHRLYTLIFRQEAPHFHFALGPVNCVAGYGCQAACRPPHPPTPMCRVKGI